MKKWRVYGIWTASKFLGEFEAETQEDAEDMAAESNANNASLCHHCARELNLCDQSASSFDVEEVPDAV